MSARGLPAVDGGQQADAPVELWFAVVATSAAQIERRADRMRRGRRALALKAGQRAERLNGERRHELSNRLTGQARRPPVASELMWVGARHVDRKLVGC